MRLFQITKTSAITIALLLPFWVSPVEAQSTKGESKMMKQCQEMKEKKQSMKEDSAAQDAQLTDQLAKMNAAPVDQKTDLLAAAVTHMVEQRITMDARKAKMEEEMMQHMMEHMQMGKESMSHCPMMKGMDDKPAGAHEHH